MIPPSAYRVIVAAMLGIIAVVVAYFHITVTWPQMPSDQVDFRVFWDAAHMTLHADAAGVYANSYHNMDESIHTGRPDEDWAGPFAYPPTFLMIITPLGLFDYDLAYKVWNGLCLVIFLSVMCLPRVRQAAAPFMTFGWFRATYIPMLALSVYALTNVQQGQVGLLTASLLIAGLCYRQTQPTLSGVLMGVLMIKPHLALILPLVLLLEKNAKVLVSMVITVLALMIGTALLFGAEAWLGFWLQLPMFAEYQIRDLDGTSASLTSLYALFTHLGVERGDALMAHLGVVTLLLLVLMATYKRFRSDNARTAFVLTLGLMMSPYILIHDLVPMLWVLCVWLAHYYTKPTVLGLVGAVVLAVLPMIALYSNLAGMSVGALILLLAAERLVWIGMKVESVD